MRRYRYNLDLNVDSEVEIQDELFKHIIVVCRNQIGDQFELLKNEFAYLSEIIRINKKTAAIRILSSRRIPDLPKPFIHLVLANPKTQVLETVVEKSVELGVKSIYLLATEKSFFKSVDKIRLKEKRLEKIISQALQQSNRHDELILRQPCDFLAFMELYKSLDSKKGFVLYEKTEVSSTTTNPLKQGQDAVDDIYLMVGAEGGFTAPEAKLAFSVGFEALSLGRQILRVETACVAGLSILKSRLQIW
jgi:16S rRNA (uracil1498-N3)-methyltransferase